MGEVDPTAFARDLAELRAELESGLGPRDLAHFVKMKRWGRLCAAAGYATAWIAPNPLSAVLLSLGTTARWTIVMHHVGHRGLDRVPGASPRFRSKTFALGKRRLLDWLDWFTPEAWNHEHNVLHHYRTGELEDPDLVEHNMQPVRDWNGPRALKWLVIGFYACTWKLTYYAPNTWATFTRAKRLRSERRGEDDVGPLPSTLETIDPRTTHGRAFFASLLPYGFARFVAAPLAFLPLGPWAALSVLSNSLIAELLTNLHTFVLIAPNHSGDDLYRFDSPVRDRAEFTLRQVLGTASYTGGTDVTDFLQGYLNYQIEHHLFPELPPLKVREAQPRVRALCQKHGVPYVQEPLLSRVRRLLGVMMGDASMRRATHAQDALATPRTDASATPRTDAVEKGTGARTSPSTTL